MVHKFQVKRLFFSTIPPPLLFYSSRSWRACESQTGSTKKGRACESRSSSYSSSTSFIFGFIFGESPPEAHTLLGYTFGSHTDV